MPLLKLSKSSISKIIILFFLVLILSSYFINMADLKNEEKSQFSANNEFTYNDMWGEPAKDMFPELNNPSYVTKEKANEFLKEDDVVYFFKIKDNTYVYPASILGFHHIVNDVIEKKPLAITFCVLSRTALVYPGEIDGKTVSFGVLGPLYYGNLVMYDKNSDSYLLQLTGDSFYGKMKGKKINPLLAMEETKWGNIKNFDDLKVLSPSLKMDFYRDFYKKAKDNKVGLNSLKGKKELDKRLDPFTFGLGVEVSNEEKYYPLAEIMDKKIINDRVGSWSLLILYDKKMDSYKMFRRYLNHQRLTFKDGGEYVIDKETNSKWDFNGVAFEGKLKGKKLISPFYGQAYWFSWSAFFPKTSVYGD